MFFVSVPPAFIHRTQYTIVYCKNNQGCGLISTALILYDFIGIYLRRLLEVRFAPERLLRSAAPRRAELPRLPRC